MSQIAMPELTAEQKEEIESVFNNEALLDFMESGIPNTGEEDPEDIILERGRKAVEAFSQSKDSWSFF